MHDRVINGQVSFDFCGKVVIITGAARGIGRAMVKAFVNSGARVVAADRDAEGLLETCASLGDWVAAVGADVSTVEGARSIVEEAVNRFGGVDVCVNNAAVAPHTALLEERVEVWDRVYAVNCRGTFLMTQVAAQAMLKNGGRIINFSSAVAKRGSPGGAAYASSRAAVEAFTRVTSIELAPYGITVNIVSPGLIESQPKPLPEVMAKALKARIPTLPLARPGKPEEVVGVVLFLASDASSYINGAVLSVDGGASVGTRDTKQIVDDDPRYFWVTDRE
jgi:NAD(P)-dependent dehydrogenase (short-subunit alcohol dehydrogenase family)